MRELIIWRCAGAAFGAGGGSGGSAGASGVIQMADFPMNK